MKHRPAPRRAGGQSGAIGRLVSSLQPAGLLAEVQRVWPAVGGPALAGRAVPTGARDGVVDLRCESAVWAQELALMEDELVALLCAELGATAVRGLRCTVAPARARPAR